jgi:transposase
MPRPLSNDLRKRLIRLVESGMSARAAGARLDRAASTATGIVKDWRDRGSYEPLPTGGWRRPKREDEADFIEQLVADHGDWSEAEWNAYVREHRGIEVHDTTLGRFIRAKGWRYKKNGIRQATGRGGYKGSQSAVAGVAGKLRRIEAGVSG